VAATASQVHLSEDGDLYERSENGWRRCDLPVAEPVADVAYGESAYAVTEDGTFLANAGDGWRHRSLGLPGVVGLAVR
jgi:hypothetical protein